MSAEEAASALSTRLQKWSGAYHDGHDGPSDHVYWFLAHHLDAATVRFADVIIDEARTDQEGKGFGRIFVVTPAAVLIADYEATEDYSRRPNAPAGTIGLSVYPLASTASIRWVGHDLRLGGSLSRKADAPQRLQQGAIVVTGQGWDVRLPGRRSDDPNGYFAELCEAIGMSLRGPAQP